MLCDKYLLIFLTRSLDRQFHTDGALTYVFCKCLPLPDPVAPPRFSEVYVDGAKYWIDSAYIASHGMRFVALYSGLINYLSSSLSCFNYFKFIISPEYCS